MDPLDFFSNVPHVQELLIKHWNYQELSCATLVCKAWHNLIHQYCPRKQRKLKYYNILNEAWSKGQIEKIKIDLPPGLLNGKRVSEYQSHGEDHLILLSDRQPYISNPLVLIIVRNGKIVKIHNKIDKYLPSGIRLSNHTFESILLTKSKILWKVDYGCVLVLSRENGSIIHSLQDVMFGTIQTSPVPNLCDVFVHDKQSDTFFINNCNDSMECEGLKLGSCIADTPAILSLASFIAESKTVFPYILLKKENSDTLKVYSILSGSLLIEFSTNTSERQYPWANIWKCGIITILEKEVLKGYDLAENPGLLLFGWSVINKHCLSSSTNSFQAVRGTKRYPTTPQREAYYWNRYTGEKYYLNNLPRCQFSDLKIGPLSYLLYGSNKIVLATTADSSDDVTNSELLSKYKNLIFDQSGRHGIQLLNYQKESALEIYYVSI